MDDDVAALEGRAAKTPVGRGAVAGAALQVDVLRHLLLEGGVWDPAGGLGERGDGREREGGEQGRCSHRGSQLRGFGRAAP